MCDLKVYKANSLVVSRYDLTDQETRLILYAVGKINPMIKNPTKEQRTVYIPYDIYAQEMDIKPELAWHNLNNAVKDLMTRTITIIYPDPSIPVEKRIFQWVNLAVFNRRTQQVELVFSEDIQPYLYGLNEFIHYKLDNVKSLNNKFSMRIYEILLKELGMKKANRLEFSLSISDFKHILNIENIYPTFKAFNARILKPVIEDINANTDLKVKVKSQGRPADILIFNVEKTQQLDLLQEINKKDKQAKSDSIVAKKRYDIACSLLNYHSIGAIFIKNKKDIDFLQGVKLKFETKGDLILTPKQIKYLDDLNVNYIAKKYK